MRRFKRFHSFGDLGTMRRRSFRGFDALPVSLDAFLPPLVGGGAAMGTALIIRGVVKPYQLMEDGKTIKMSTETVPKPLRNSLFKYSGLIGAGVGVLGSCILGPFKGWGSAIAGSITAVATGLTLQLADTILGEDAKAQYKAQNPYALMVARRNLQALPYVRQRAYAQNLVNMGPNNPQLPENVTVFPKAQAVNMRAFGG